MGRLRRYLTFQTYVFMKSVDYELFHSSLSPLIVIPKGRTSDQIVKNLAEVIDDEPVSDVFSVIFIIRRTLELGTNRGDIYDEAKDSKLQKRYA
ncbi:unnamed protein product [Dovyalis caffra]|uniref:Uncharacterized protein n=1 Tax=Dovyalis caffra TaxID=77055 RepID=A0AAV1RXL6_9ROSI|nr:unnamed protein product [Dovyalis caffra]